MKNTGRIITRFLFCIFSSVFLLSCGLETVIVVDPPQGIHTDCYYSTTNYLEWYSEFWTNERNAVESFIGTSVYYKIYNNYSTLVSEKNSINALSESSNTANTSATRMIETYSYQELGRNPINTDSVTIPSKGGNRKVYIRLNTDGVGDDLKADMRIADSSVGVPFRYDNNLSFDLFDNDDNDDSNKVDVEPLENDMDYKHNSSGFSSGYDKTYFVQLYAVGIAINTETVSYSYSPTLDLGTIPVVKK